MSDKLPYFPVWVKDFLGDNRVDAMTAEELGAYFRLLLMAWQEDPAATLPPDEGLLARWARLDTARWMACRERILACFTKGRDGRLIQKRLREEWEVAAGLSRKRSKAGKAGADARWQSHAIAIDVPMAKGCDSGYGSGSDPPKSQAGKDRGAGERKPSGLPFDCTPEGLAQRWCFDCSRKKRGFCADQERDMAAGFAELIRLGCNPEELLRELADEKRDRGEHFWQFRDRVKRVSPVHSNGHAETKVERLERQKREREACKTPSPNGSKSTH